jgi:RNA polymerase sigma-70 factor (ECF subfamily)
MNSSKASEINKIVDHFFRHKAGQLISTLTRIFGPGQIDLAESVVQEALLRACQAWSIKGIPPNPDGWITTVAKNHALDLIRKKKRFHQKEEEIIRWYESRESDHLEAHDAPEAMDDQLRMMFVCCHPSLSRKSQVALTLKTVGGFSDREIARAFLSNDETARKLLTRAKQKLRAENISFDLPAPQELPQRLDAVLEVLYLIFNEGYNAHEGDALIRQDFCDEAIRLTSLFLFGTFSASPKLPTIKALLALMLLHSSRIPARTDVEGNLITLAEQDRSRWDKRRIAMGLQYLGESASGEELSLYHLQAHIAACHAVAPNSEELDWPRILSYYDRLLNLSSNPVIALNRAVAISMVNGPKAGLKELKLLAHEPLLKNYYLLPATMADFYRKLDNKPKALEYYLQALALVGTRAEKHYLEERMRECQVMA